MGGAPQGAAYIGLAATRQAHGRARRGWSSPFTSPQWAELAGPAGQFGGHEVEAPADGGG
jgi:hypothetical protein